MTRPARGARARARHVRVPRGALGPTSPLFTEVLEVSRRRRGPRLAGLLLPALAAGGLVALLASPPPVHVEPPRPRKVLASLLRPPPPPAPPEPPPPEEPPPPPPKRKVPPPVGDTSPDPAPEPLPETAAQAGQVVAQSAPADELSAEDFRLAVGAGVGHVGGLTSSVGKSDKAVEGGGGGTGKGFGSKAREAWPKRTDWTCEWPRTAEGVERVATLRIRVSAEGVAEDVEVLKAPTPELGEVVRRCALQEKYHPARDALGRNVASTTRALTIRFLRQ